MGLKLFLIHEVFNLLTINILISDFPLDGNGDAILPFRRWGSRPYVEVGYGVENIFKLFTVEGIVHFLVQINFLNSNSSLKTLFWLD